jgi:hypothetical protein
MPSEEKIYRAAKCVIEYCGEKKTLVEYLKECLANLWDEGEHFSGKRPLGDSGWTGDIYRAFVRDGLVPGTLDADGYVEGPYEWGPVDELILAVIKRLTMPITEYKEEPMHQRMGL